MRGKGCVDLYSRTAAVNAGKPLELHGTHGRIYATGRGAVLAARELLKAEHAGRIQGKEFIIQVPPFWLCTDSTPVLADSKRECTYLLKHTAGKHCTSEALSRPASRHKVHC